VVIDVRGLDDLAQRLAALVPTDFQAAQQDLGATFKAALQSGLSRLNLVTREEFDVQRLVLLRTREKVEGLEKQVAALEQSISRLAQRH
jgi:ubiquinone biosynthesis accessory factor UbiK